MPREEEAWFQTTPLPIQLPLPEGVVPPLGWEAVKSVVGKLVRIDCHACVLPPRVWAWNDEHGCEVDQDGYTRKGFHVLHGFDVYGWYPGDRNRDNVQKPGTLNALASAYWGDQTLSTEDLARTEWVAEWVPHDKHRWGNAVFMCDLRYVSPDVKIVSDLKRSMDAFDLSTEGGGFDANNKDSDGRDVDGYDTDGYDNEGVDSYGFDCFGEYVGRQRCKRLRCRIGKREGKPRVTGAATGRPPQQSANGAPRRDQGPCWDRVLTAGTTDKVWQLACKGCGAKWIPVAAFAPDPRKPSERADFAIFAELHEDLNSDVPVVCSAASDKLGFKPPRREARANDDADGDGLELLWQKNEELKRLPVEQGKPKTYRAARCRKCREKGRKAKGDETPAEAAEREYQQGRWDALIDNPAKYKLDENFGNGSASQASPEEEHASAAQYVALAGESSPEAMEELENQLKGAHATRPQPRPRPHVSAPAVQGARPFTESARC